MAALTFLSVGHSTRTLEELVDLLRAGGVEILADIRHFPASRRHPHFARSSLERELPTRGIEYVWLGETLGGFRPGGYEAWTATDDYRRGIEALEALAARGRTAFMCAEIVPYRCHRRHVARTLVLRGHRVLHLIDRGRQVWEPGPLPPSGTSGAGGS